MKDVTSTKMFYGSLMDRELSEVPFHSLVNHDDKMDFQKPNWHFSPVSEASHS